MQMPGAVNSLQGNRPQQNKAYEKPDTCGKFMMMSSCIEFL